MVNDGSVAPRSNREIDSGSSETASAKSDCVIPWDLRWAAMFFPKRFASDSDDSDSTIYVALKGHLWLLLCPSLDRTSNDYKYRHIVLVFVADTAAKRHILPL